MDRNGFKNRMQQYKKAREENPGLKYWEWKAAPKYDEGGEVLELYYAPKTVEGILAKTAIQLADPTGISSYPDVWYSGKEFLNSPSWSNLKDVGINTLSALPLIGKVTAPFKAAKMAKLLARIEDANALVKGVENANRLNKVIDTFPELLPVIRRGAEKVQDVTSALVTNPIFDYMTNRNKFDLVRNYRNMNAAVDAVNISNNTADVAQGIESLMGYSEGGEVEPDPLEILERSRPKVAGIPINDRPLSGTDPIGEAMMWGLGGGAASAALRSIFPTYGATAGWLAFGDNGNENALVVKKPLRKGDPTVKPISTGNISEGTRDFYREYVMPLSDHLTEQEKLDFINNNANFTYNVYPESRFDEGVLGFRNKYTGEIALNEKILDDPIIFGRTMAHESDHALEQVKERPSWQTLKINRNSPRTKDQKKTRMGSNSEAYATHEANKWDIVNNFELENGRKPTLEEFQQYTGVVPAKTLSSFRNRDSYGRMYEENEIKKLAQKHLTVYDYSKWLDTNKRNTLKYVPATIPFILTTNKEES